MKVLSKHFKCETMVHILVKEQNISLNLSSELSEGITYTHYSLDPHVHMIYPGQGKKLKIVLFLLYQCVPYIYLDMKMFVHEHLDIGQFDIR